MKEDYGSFIHDENLYNVIFTKDNMDVYKNCLSFVSDMTKDAKCKILCIYGESGVGKSFLKSSLLNYIKKQYTDLRIVSKTLMDLGWDFSRDCNKSCRKFERKHYFEDVLIIDEYEHLKISSKQFQRSINNIMESLVYQDKRCVVFSRDNPRKTETEVTMLDEDKIVRMVELKGTENLDKETAIDILKFYARKHRIYNFLNDEIYEYIVDSKTPLRLSRLDSYIILLSIYSMNEFGKMSLYTAKEALKDVS